MITNEIPQSVKTLAHEYLNLNINGCNVRTPYYRNVKRIRAELRSLVGKGLPAEIIEETLIYSKLRGFDLKGKSEFEIREFMASQGIGIDCSGFVAHLYDRWLRSSNKGSITSNLKFSNNTFYRKFVRKLRPIENISADDLTNYDNCIKIELNQTEPGDLIRMKGVKHGDHLAIIYSVSTDEAGQIIEITYIHSSPAYQSENGVKFGQIEITDPNGELKDQQWNEFDIDGKCWTLQCLLKDYSDNGLRRPKFLLKSE